MGREKLRYGRKLISFRLMPSQIQSIKEASKVLGKSNTAVVEEAIGMYINQLRINKVM